MKYKRRLQKHTAAVSGPLKASLVRILAQFDLCKNMYVFEYCTLVCKYPAKSIIQFAALIFPLVVFEST